GWSGTSDDAGTAATSSMIMPAEAHAVSVAYAAFPEPALANGVPVDDSLNATVAQGTWKYYSADLELGSANFLATLSGLTGDVDLYVRSGAKPTLGSFHCRPHSSGTVDERCSFTAPTPGRW